MLASYFVLLFLPTSSFEECNFSKTKNLVTSFLALHPPKAYPGLRMWSNSVRVSWAIAWPPNQPHPQHHPNNLQQSPQCHMGTGSHCSVYLEYTAHLALSPKDHCHQFYNLGMRVDPALLAIIQDGQVCSRGGHSATYHSKPKQNKLASDFAIKINN